MTAPANLPLLAAHIDRVRETNRRAVLRALRANGPTTPARLAQRLPLCRAAILSHLRVLAAMGDAARTGRGPSTRWRAL